ncbi:MAG TPA: Holliday junction resolvase RuvX [Syntrophaceae bacterium]|nr:Holliday junction resolvase RuvX [Syntrophaceae bacterium]
MRIMGLDVGDCTIGVAVSDEMGWTAQGLTTIRRSSIEKDLAAIKKLLNIYNAEEVVIGLPKNMDGSLGKRANLVLEFVDSLKGRLSIPITTWDERLSTVAVTKVLLEADMSRKKRKRVVDKLAATYILQGYLDSKKGLRK